MKQAKIRDHAITCILFVLIVFAQWQGMDEGGLDGVAFHVKDRQRGSATFRSSRFQSSIGVQWRVCRFCAVLFQNGVRRASPCHERAASELPPRCIDGYARVKDDKDDKRSVLRRKVAHFFHRLSAEVLKPI